MRNNRITLALSVPLLSLSLNVFSSINPSDLYLKPVTDPVVNIPVNENGSVKYRLTNKGKKAYRLQLSPIQGLIQETGKPKLCGQNIDLPPGKSCLLSFIIDGSEAIPMTKSGPVLCDKGWKSSDEAGYAANTCIQPAMDDRLSLNFVTPPKVTLSIKVDGEEKTTAKTNKMGCFASRKGCALTLFQNSSTQKSITLTNTSQERGKDIQAYGLPEGVTQDASQCKELMPNSSCTIYFKSGSTRTLSKAVEIKGTNTINSSITMQVLDIGDPYAGGIVACMNGGLQNLIAASVNNSHDMGWGSTKIRTFATSSRDGQRNTKKIISALGNNDDIPYAAQLCDDYEVDSEGNSPCKTGTCYSNWFLPAENQLYCLYDNAPWIAQFPQGDYWSSTEVADEKMSTAFAMLMISRAAGSATSYFKDNLESIRCVSIFNP